MAWQAIVGQLAAGAPDPRERVLDEDVRLEIEAHLAMRTEDNVAAGMEPAAARRDAERRFGDVEAIARACREPWIGGRIMLQRAFLVVTLVLALGIAWMFLQNRRLVAQTEQARAVAMERTAVALQAERELRLQYETSGDLVFRVGDRVDIRGFSADIVEVVQRDGKLLVPDVGWLDVAGRPRTEVEAELRQALEPYWEHVPTVNLVVVDDAESR
jgi:hypothetical protein